MTVQDGVKLPADARAVIMAPNLVSARFIQLTPAYTDGPAMADGASIELDRTAVPVEWDEVKTELTRLSQQLGPRQGSSPGAAERVREPGRRHLRRQRRLVPASAARAVADGRAAGRLAHRPVRHREQSAGAWSTRCPTATSRSCSSPTTWRRCRRCLADSSVESGRHAGQPQPGAVRRPGFPQRAQRDADRQRRQADRLHQHPHRPQRRHRADPARHAERRWRTSTTSTTPPRAPSAACCRCRTSPTRCSSSAVARSTSGHRPTTTSGPRSAGSGWLRCSDASR